MKVEGVIDATVTAATESAEVTCLKTVDGKDLAAAVRGDFSASVRKD
jgi:hypothetical protein